MDKARPVLRPRYLCLVVGVAVVVGLGCSSGRVVRLSDETLPPPPLPTTMTVRGQSPEYGYSSIPPDEGQPPLLDFDSSAPAAQPGADLAPPAPPSAQPWSLPGQEPPWHRWAMNLFRPVPCGTAAPSFDGQCPTGTYPIEYVPFANTWAFAYYDGFDLPEGGFRNAARLGVNWGFPLFSDYVGFGGQIGGSGSVTEDQEQVFVTAGLFWRGDMQYGSAWNVGAVFDFMHDGLLETQVTQVRGQISYVADFRNEFGVWGAGRTSDDITVSNRVAEPVGQVNLFWRHLWTVGLDTTVWVGWRDGQSKADESNDASGAAIGARVYYPLTESWALAAGGHNAFDSDTWNVWGGVEFSFGGLARPRFLGQYRHAPLLPVADNSTMTLAIEPR